MPYTPTDLVIATDHVHTNHVLAISSKGRSQHAYIVGKTGCGKSTLLRNLIIAEIAAGNGVGFLDPHGSEAESLLDAIPAHRIRETIYFNPSDEESVIPFNVLAGVPPARRHLVADSIVGAFKNIWGYFWGARMEYILFNAVASLLEAGGRSLADIRPLLTDRDFRARTVKRVRDLELRAFWQAEFDVWLPRFREEAIAPILNKVGQLMASPPLRRTLGHPKRHLDMRRMMDSGQIFIANLTKGGLGESKAGLLGSFLVSAFQEAALSRPSKEAATKAGIPEPSPFTLFIDEFQSFATEAFSTILSESRKYGLHLVLAHQFTSQLSDEVRDAIFGNVASIIAFRVGSADAAILSREFDDEFSPRRFTELPNFRVATRLPEGDGTGAIRLGQTFPPQKVNHGYGGSIVKLNRSRLAA